MSREDKVMENDEVKINRRHEPRVAVQVGITLTSDSNLFVGFSGNISEGGLFVATHELLPIGSKLELEFCLPNDEEPICSRAEVRWHRTVSDPQNGVLPGFGARFIEVTQTDVTRIEDFISGREPLFHPE